MVNRIILFIVLNLYFVIIINPLEVFTCVVDNSQYQSYSTASRLFLFSTKFFMVNLTVAFITTTCLFYREGWAGWK